MKKQQLTCYRISCPEALTSERVLQTEPPFCQHSTPYNLLAHSTFPASQSGSTCTPTSWTYRVCPPLTCRVRLPRSFPTTQWALNLIKCAWYPLWVIHLFVLAGFKLHRQQVYLFMPSSLRGSVPANYQHDYHINWYTHQQQSLMYFVGKFRTSFYR